MTDALFLGLDVGSSSTKGVLVDASGRTEAVVELPHTISRPRPGWAEQDAERDWWDSVAEACRRLADGRAARVTAVGICGLGPCLLPADGDGLPLRPAILYGIDTRAREQIERLTAELGADEILARCGSVLSSQSVGPKLRWLAEREPEVWAAARHVFGAGSYLVFRLTGEYVLDHHSASHWAPLYDVSRNEWIGEWTDVVAPGLALPRLVWPHETSGRLSREAAAATGLPEGIPVAGGTVDSWAEVAASGLRGPGEGLLVYGTSMFVTEVHTPARLDRRLWGTVGFAPGALNVAAGVGSAGALMAWLRELTGGASFDELYEEAAGAGPGAGGLLALPYFAGERAPLFDPDLRGALFGLTAAHGGATSSALCLEATAFAVRQDLETMGEAGATICASAKQRRRDVGPAVAADRLGRDGARPGGPPRRVRCGRGRGLLRGRRRRRRDARRRLARPWCDRRALRRAARDVRRALRAVPGAGAGDAASGARPRGMAAPSRMVRRTRRVARAPGSARRRAGLMFFTRRLP